MVTTTQTFPDVVFVVDEPVETVTAPPAISSVDEIIQRLGQALNFSEEHARLLRPWFADMTLATLGRYVTLHVHGLSLFEAQSPWSFVGVTEESVRAQLMKGKPRWYLADTKVMEPFRTLENALRRLPERYHCFWIEERSCWYVPYKVEVHLVQAVDILRAKWAEQVQKLIDDLPVIRQSAWVQVEQAANETYDTVQDEIQLTRAEFINPVRLWFESNFPSAQVLREKLRIFMTDRFRPEANPNRNIVEAVLGIKANVDADAAQRLAAAHGQQLHNEQISLINEEKRLTNEEIEERVTAERRAVEAMIARRLELEKETIEREAEINVAPQVAILRNARETIGVTISDLFSKLSSRDDLTAADIRRARKIISAYELVSGGEMSLDEKVAQLKGLVSENRAARSKVDLRRVMGEIAQMTATEVSRVQAMDTGAWLGMFTGMNHKQEIEHGENNED